MVIPLRIMRFFYFTEKGEIEEEKLVFSEEFSAGKISLTETKCI